MGQRPISVVPAAALQEGFDAIRREADVPRAFPPEVEAEAREAASRGPNRADRVDLPFVTIDPAGSRDLDQALHIERRDGGHRVHYAIADVAAFVAPGGPLDAEAHARAVTVYAPDAKTPLHPPALSEGSASLLPGQWTPAVLWMLDLDDAGELVSTDVARAEVRSVAQHTYADIPPPLAALLAEVGERRIALEIARGGVQLELPEQEVVREDGSWTVRYRAPLETEDHNAQVSLLTGMASAQLMLKAGTGVLRTQPPPDERSLTRLRRQASALGVPWPAAMAYPDFVRSLDPRLPAHAALMHEAAGVGRAASYTAFDGEPPAEVEHFAIAGSYAHATAPLRRLQDRYVSECCLAAAAGAAIPEWVHAGLAALPDAMAAGTRRAGVVERGVVDLLEAALLSGREGERFAGVVVDEKLVQLAEPAVRARLDGHAPEPGSDVTVRLDKADLASRTVRFSVAS
jgi:exoribonuclease R